MFYLPFADKQHQVSNAMVMETFSPESETRRLDALHASGLMDSAPEQDFDELVQLATAICGVPISLVSLVDDHRQWFKARIGLDVSETPREMAFCAHAIQQDNLFVVPDTFEDERFASNALVLGAPYLRFYAGYPLSTETGEKLGTLCVLDRVPRKLTAAQEKALEVLARQVMTQIKLRKKVAALDEAAHERDELTRKLAASDACFRGFMDASPAAAFIKDHSGRMVYCNQALTARHGAKPTDWLGKDDSEIWPAESAMRLRKADLAVLEDNAALHFEESMTAIDGKVMTWNVYKFPFANADGERFVASVALDVTKEREAERELQHYQQELRELNLKLRKLSLTDALTLVKNRRGFEDDLEREFARSRRSRAPLSMLMLDVDHFKQFNDTHGHVAGDRVLQRIAGLMTEHTRKADIVARYGGEEFIALLPDTGEAEALYVAQRLCQFVAAAPWKHRQITVSVGVGTLRDTMSESSLFINTVDGALYRAKNGGRNQVCLASDSSGSPAADPLLEPAENELNV